MVRTRWSRGAVEGWYWTEFEAIVPWTAVCGLAYMEAMSQTLTPYQQLVTELREIALLGSVAALLDWDEQTQLPAKGAENRAAQAALLARMKHERFTSPRVGNLLDGAGQSSEAKDLESDVAVN